jgi:phosphatidylinositol glycan class M
MLAQTFAFVSFNKVCTSQVIPPLRTVPFSFPSLTPKLKWLTRMCIKYFLWYTILLPLYLSLPSCSLLSSPRTGLTALILWIAAQALWLQQGFQLEFLGESTFVPGLWFAGLGFFAVNCWILGIVVQDIGNAPGSAIVGQVARKVEGVGGGKEKVKRWL